MCMTLLYASQLQRKQKSIKMYKTFITYFFSDINSLYVKCKDTKWLVGLSGNVTNCTRENDKALS